MTQQKSSKVSIVIPVYNGSNYLKEAIDSALAQTYKNFEVIVVNDGSTDRGMTEKIAKSYGDKIRYFKKKNCGAASALNFGIKKMTGSWFSWLSHDDVYEPNKLQAQISIVTKFPDAKFIFGKHVAIDEKGKYHKRGEHDWKPNKNKPFIRQMFNDNYISGCTTLVHKDVFDKVGLFNEANKTAQDYEMWINISAHYPMYRCPQVVLKSRWHSEMGTIILKEQNKKDILDSIRNVEKTLTIEKFYSDKLSKSSSKEQKARYQHKFGDLLMNRWDLDDLADKHYRMAYELWPSLSNPVIIRKILGAKVYHLPTSIRKSFNMLVWNARVRLGLTQT